MGNGYYVIKTLSMATYLIRQGFDLLKVDDSLRDPKKKVFLFEDTPALRKAMEEYSQNRR